MLTLLLSIVFAATQPDPANAILGQWEGSSICLKIEENRFCHDELVRYNFTRDGDVFKLKADKKVNGKYEWMGDLDATYDAAARSWVAPFKGPRAQGIWSFTVDGDKLSGTCILLPSKTLVRNASAVRVKP